MRDRTGDFHGDPSLRPLLDRPLQYRFGRQRGGGRPLSHPLIAMLRAVRDGGSIQAVSRAQSVSYRHA